MEGRTFFFASVIHTGFSIFGTFQLPKAWSKVDSLTKKVYLVDTLVKLDFFYIVRRVLDVEGVLLM